jgi:CheY-like chemotaxis protein
MAVRGAEKLLRRVIGEEIVLETALGTNVGIVCADAGQLDQVLLNLAVNARDAMLTAAHGHAGSGGTLTLETGTAMLDARAAATWAPLAPGRYVRLVVRDTGHGMDQATRTHAFEPFFTTKEVGAGTGLGLATVYGIVAQSGGAVRLDSTPGQGTTVTILLPEVEAHPNASEAGAAAQIAASPHGLVLLVEDEAAVRATARRILERHGYAVLEARHGADALLLWRAHRDEVTAVVTDLRMPEMGGRELATVLREERPELPLVLVTGYADQPLVSHLGVRAAYVEKPFTGDALLAALRQVLAGEG